MPWKEAQRKNLAEWELLLKVQTLMSHLNNDFIVVVSFLVIL